MHTKSQQQTLRKMITQTLEKTPMATNVRKVSQTCDKILHLIEMDNDVNRLHELELEVARCKNTIAHDQSTITELRIVVERQNTRLHHLEDKLRHSQMSLINKDHEYRATHRDLVDMVEVRNKLRTELESVTNICKEKLQNQRDLIITEHDHRTGQQQQELVDMNIVCDHLRTRITEIQNDHVQYIQTIQELHVKQIQSATETLEDRLKDKEKHLRDKDLKHQQLQVLWSAALTEIQLLKQQKEKICTERDHIMTKHDRLLILEQEIRTVLPGTLLNDLIQVKKARRAQIENVMETLKKGVATTPLEVGCRQEVWDIIAIHALFPFLTIIDSHSTSHAGDMIIMLKEKDLRISVLFDSKACLKKTVQNSTIPAEWIKKLESDRHSVNNTGKHDIRYAVLLIPPQRNPPRNCIVPDASVHFWVDKTHPHLCFAKRDSGRAILHAIMYTMVRSAYDMGRSDGSLEGLQRCKALRSMVDTMNQHRHGAMHRLQKFTAHEGVHHKRESTYARETLRDVGIKLTNHDVGVVGTKKRKL